MKKYRISRVYAVRHYWVVECFDDKSALRMLEDENVTCSNDFEEDWMGGVLSISVNELVDMAQVVS